MKFAGAIAGVAALCQVPYASALDTIQIPKLSYNPTVGQLISDFDLQKQMVAVDQSLQLNPSGTPANLGFAKVGLGFDDNYVNFVDAHIAQKIKPNDEVMEICVDKKFSRMAFLTPDAFFCRYHYNFSDTTGLQTYANYIVGSNDFRDAVPLPTDFKWKAAFTKSYFNQDNEHPVMAAQIPSSYMGPGGQDGKYGIHANISSNVDGLSSWDSLNYPANSDNNLPNTFGAFSTQYPIPEFPRELNLLTLPLAFVLGLMSIRKNRMEHR